MANRDDQAVLSTFIEYLNSFQQDKSLVIKPLQHDAQAVSILNGINENIYNSVFIDNPDNINGLIDELKALKKDHGNLPLTVWVSCNTKNEEVEVEFKKQFTSPGRFFGMSLDLAKTNLAPNSQAFTIEKVTSEQQAKIFSQLFCEIFNWPNFESRMLSWTIQQYDIASPSSINYLANVNGVYAGVSSLIIDKHFDEFKAGGFYKACVLPQFRKKGLGFAMASHRAQEAKKLGFEKLTILLMSDAMARGYCQQIGFKPLAAMTPYFVE